jgi:hypothetical protein
MAVGNILLIEMVKEIQAGVLTQTRGVVQYRPEFAMV